MDRQQQIQQLTNASAQLVGVIDRLRAQESGTASAHSSEAQTGSGQTTNRQILEQVTTEISEVSATL